MNMIGDKHNSEGIRPMSQNMREQIFGKGKTKAKADKDDFIRTSSKFQGALSRNKSKIRQFGGFSKMSGESSAIPGSEGTPNNLIFSFNNTNSGPFATNSVIKRNFSPLQGLGISDSFQRQIDNTPQTPLQNTIEKTSKMRISTPLQVNVQVQINEIPSRESELVKRDHKEFITDLYGPQTEEMEIRNAAEERRKRDIEMKLKIKSDPAENRLDQLHRFGHPLKTKRNQTMQEIARETSNNQILNRSSDVYRGFPGNQNSNSDPNRFKRNLNISPRLNSSEMDINLLFTADSGDMKIKFDNNSIFVESRKAREEEIKSSTFSFHISEQVMRVQTDGGNNQLSRLCGMPKEAKPEFLGNEQKTIGEMMRMQSEPNQIEAEVEVTKRDSRKSGDRHGDLLSVRAVEKQGQLTRQATGSATMKRNSFQKKETESRNSKNSKNSKIEEEVPNPTPTESPGSFTIKKIQILKKRVPIEIRVLGPNQISKITSIQDKVKAPKKKPVSNDCNVWKLREELDTLRKVVSDGYCKKKQKAQLRNISNRVGVSLERLINKEGKIKENGVVEIIQNFFQKNNMTVVQRVRTESVKELGERRGSNRKKFQTVTRMPIEESRRQTGKHRGRFQVQNFGNISEIGAVYSVSPRKVTRNKTKHTKGNSRVITLGEGQTTPKSTYHEHRNINKIFNTYKSVGTPIKKQKPQLNSVGPMSQLLQIHSRNDSKIHNSIQEIPPYVPFAEEPNLFSEPEILEKNRQMIPSQPHANNFYPVNTDDLKSNLEPNYKMQSFFMLRSEESNLANQPPPSQMFAIHPQISPIPSKDTSAKKQNPKPNHNFQKMKTHEAQTVGIKRTSNQVRYAWSQNNFATSEGLKGKYRDKDLVNIRASAHVSPHRSGPDIGFFSGTGLADGNVQKGFEGIVNHNDMYFKSKVRKPSLQF